MKLKRLLTTLMIAVLILPGCQTTRIDLRGNSKIGSGEGVEEYSRPLPVVVDTEDGTCREEYPYCLSDRGHRLFEKAMAIARAGKSELAKCQGSLDSVPREMEVTVEQVVVKETPWWNWVVIGALGALIPVGIGVGFYMGAK